MRDFSIASYVSQICLNPSAMDVVFGFSFVPYLPVIFWGYPMSIALLECMVFASSLHELYQ
jgi:hypothetical protein